MSVLLELLIGLALLYLLTSVVASFVVEAVASYLKLRARCLEGCIAQLVAGGVNRVEAAGGESARWASNFYEHPLIRALSTARVGAADAASRPSYIPREQYAGVLLDMVRKIANLPPGEPLSIARLREIVREKGDMLPGGVRSRIETALSNGADSLDQVRTSMEAGFDAAMERASGWYKRRTQIWLTLFAFCLALAFNLDSFYIGSRLLKDETLRATTLQMSVDAVSGEEAKSPERFAATVGAWVGGLRGGTSKASGNYLEAAAAGNHDAAMLALRMMHDTNHWNPVLARAGWQFLTARTPDAQSAALAVALPELASPPATPCGNEQPQAPGDGATFADWMQYLRCMATDTERRKQAIAGFRQSAFLWEQTDRVINPTLGWLLARAVLADPKSTREFDELKIYLAALDDATKKFAIGVDASLARLPEVGWISDVSTGWDGGRWLRAFLGWLATAIMAGLGAPFWFDLLGKFVNLRGVGRKPVERTATA
ncbi:hypothetical protein [Thauera sinica]|uniref:Uncharacterized protein n=1 Tax=Thauera sinica TaxID=2665146 RepID=A0ABW1ATE7_9RHOO|nr:hypothetical protein [Thauera sp. K11]